jgi:hypothetical protein
MNFLGRSSREHPILAPYFAARESRGEGFLLFLVILEMPKWQLFSAQDRNENFVITVAFSG